MSISTRYKQLSAEGLISKTRQCFAEIPDTSNGNIPLVDHLMSGIALFGMKYPSLLQFDKDRNDAAVRANLESLYGIKQAPSDTYFRECLDKVDFRELRSAYKTIFSAFQRSNQLKNFAFLDNHYIISIDGTGYFSSNKIHCEQCGEKHHKNGTISYYHQMLGAVLVHPDHKEVIPLAPEPILKQDGTQKNDCERNAAKRLLQDLRREHPHLKLIVVEDALSSNAPHIRQLQDLDLRFIIGVKPSDHKFLFKFVEQSQATTVYEFRDDKGFYHKFKYLNKVPLNSSNSDLKVNFLEYWEIAPNGKTQHFSWVTDFYIEISNLMQLMRGGRARWKIENETFNTLKNQGYNFEHNFGHGYKNLSTVLMYLMMIAFLIDQIQQFCCDLYRAALGVAETKNRFWRKLRSRFDLCVIPNWETFYNSIINPPVFELTPYDTS